MVKSTVTILFALVCMVSTFSFAQDRQPVGKPPSITFAELNRSDLDDGPFRIEGYVTTVYKCPPCPEGAECKPCLGDHVVITDDFGEKMYREWDFSKDPASIMRLRIFCSQPEQFESEPPWVAKKKYSFLVKVRGKLRVGKPVAEVDLLSFELVEAKPKS